MAQMLVETLAGDSDPNDFEDEYAHAVEALVQAKLECGEVKHTEQAKPSGGEVVDLLAALQKSVDAAKTSRGESTEEPAEKPPAKKATAKKAPAKKATAKKAPAKKTAAAKKTATKKAPAKKAAKKAS